MASALSTWPSERRLYEFCVSPWIFIQINNFFKLPVPGIEPLTLGFLGQSSTPTPRGTHLQVNLNLHSISIWDYTILLNYTKDIQVPILCLSYFLTMYYNCNSKFPNWYVYFMYGSPFTWFNVKCGTTISCVVFSLEMQWIAYHLVRNCICLEANRCGFHQHLLAFPFLYQFNSRIVEIFYQ